MAEPESSSLSARIEIAREPFAVGKSVNVEIDTMLDTVKVTAVPTAVLPTVPMYPFDREKSCPSIRDVLSYFSIGTRARPPMPSALYPGNREASSDMNERADKKKLPDTVFPPAAVFPNILYESANIVRFGDRRTSGLIPWNLWPTVPAR